MATAANRGAGSKWTRDPQLGDLVLAKIKCYPPCPAKVSRPEDWNQVPSARKFFVLFFGTNEIAFVALQDLEPFTEEVKNDLVNQAREKRLPKRYAKYLEEALVEICKAYDELPSSSETAKSSKTGNGLLPDRTLGLIEKPAEHLIKPPDDDGTQMLEQTEGGCFMGNLNYLGHISGTEGNVKDCGNDRKDPFPTTSKRKMPVGKDSDHPKEKKHVASKSATNLHLEQEHSPTAPCSDRETKDQKVGKESHPTEDLVLDPTVQIVLEVPKKYTTEKQLKAADRKEKKHVDATGISTRTALEALPVTVPNNSAEKESRGFEKLKMMMKPSVTDKTERKGANGSKWTRDPQLGDLVLAKVKGYPPCPAKVCRPEDWNLVPAPRKFLVLFFVTKELAYVALQDLEPFTEEVKNNLVNQAREKRLPERHVKYLEEALVEICKACDELPSSSETAKSSKTRNGTEGDVRDCRNDRKDPSPTTSKRKMPVGKDSNHPMKKKHVASKSATNLHLEQEHSPIAPCSDREPKDQKVGKESHPTEDLVLDPTVQIVRALEVPKKCTTEKQLKAADRKEKKHVDVTSISTRTAPEAVPVTVPNNSAEKESRGFEKLKMMMKPSVTDKTERRGANGSKWTRDPQLGDLVLAKVKGYPPCPAKVCRPEDWNLVPAPRKFLVLFFVTKKLAFVALQDLEPFTEEVKNDLVNQAREKHFPKRYAKCLGEALVEICKAYDELPNSCETAKSSETGTGLLPGQNLGLVEKPVEHLIKPSADGGTQKLEQMEGPVEICVSRHLILGDVVEQLGGSSVVYQTGNTEAGYVSKAEPTIPVGCCLELKSTQGAEGCAAEHASAAGEDAAGELIHDLRVRSGGRIKDANWRQSNRARQRLRKVRLSVGKLASRNLKLGSSLDNLMVENCVLRSSLRVSTKKNAELAAAVELLDTKNRELTEKIEVLEHGCDKALDDLNGAALALCSLGDCMQQGAVEETGGMATGGDSKQPSTDDSL
ncbi:uncharacterized protein [Lolium perenne]|uniref:uncharacterized protein isoform X2 n=1 Tax=Lolium perenne TaxID=4522 RepID=UPI0021F5E156|nr:uncharacterized protein LOC127311834 isoform X2 [Lolium perenne]